MKNINIKKLILLCLGLVNYLFSSISIQAQSANTLLLPTTGGGDVSILNSEIELRNNLLDLGLKFILYIALVFSYWLVLRFVLWIGRKTLNSDTIFKLLKFSSIALFIVSSLVTILFAFVGNLSFLITSFGVLSAALVVALQDFVSSFFAWMMVKLKSQYKINDTIELNSSKGVFTGKVREIGLFRTTLKEKVGGQGLDKEFYTGKIVSFPNNLVLKEGLINQTVDNKLLWHPIDITITFESDYEKASLILTEIANQQFAYAIDHKDSLLDDVYNLKSMYKPKIYLNIASDGVQFVIWFATRRERYRETVEEYSREIMRKFKAGNIHFAYRTSRILSSQFQQTPVFPA
jgi:small-conductance mechanosensitive channel